MCRMAGVVFQNRFPMNALTNLKEVSCVGLIPGEEKPGHRDGWGIVTFNDGTPTYVGRSTKWACDDPDFEGALDEVMLTKPPSILITHVRAASKGSARIENTHPFIVDGIALAHNGTIKGYKSESSRTRMGDADSELLALVLADRYDETGDMRKALKSVIHEEVDANEFTAAILLASDGKSLCGYRDYSNEKTASYYDLNILSQPDSVVLFQESVKPTAGQLSQVKKRELVCISAALSIHREMIR